MSLPQSISETAQWFSAKAGMMPNPDKLCETRDVFQARLDSLFLHLTKNGFSIEDSALLVAVLGEIGNNSFDHNLGQWQDASGCVLVFELTHKHFLGGIADRGRGIFQSLKKVLPDLKQPQEALKIAFEKKISGRAPEKRGNGLKFVRNSLNGSPLKGLLCLTEGASIALGGHSMDAAEKQLDAYKHATGVFTLIDWTSV